MKSLFMTLLRNFIVFGLLFAWLFEHVAGAGNLFGAYVSILAVVALIGVCVPPDSEKSLKHKFQGKFLRTLDVIAQWVALAVLVWFGHFVLSVEWALLCIAITVIRARGLEAQKNAELEAMLNDKDSPLAAFAARNKEKMPNPSPLEPAFARGGVGKPSFTS